MSSPLNISYSAIFSLCIQCWSLMTFIIFSSSISICIISSLFRFLYFLLVFFPFCIQSLYSWTFVVVLHVFISTISNLIFLCTLYWLYLSMYHFGHVNQRNAKSAGPNQEIIPDNTSLRDRRWNKKLFALSSAYIRTQQETNILGNPPSPIQIVHTHPARNLTPPPPKRTHKNYILTNAHTQTVRYCTHREIRTTNQQT